MRQNKRVSCAIVKRDAPSKKDRSAKRKTVKRQTVFKSGNWYERAASSISAAPRG